MEMRKLKRGLFPALIKKMILKNRQNRKKSRNNLDLTTVFVINFNKAWKAYVTWIQNIWEIFPIEVKKQIVVRIQS